MTSMRNDSPVIEESIQLAPKHRASKIPTHVGMAMLSTHEQVSLLSAIFSRSTGGMAFVNPRMILRAANTSFTTHMNLSFDRVLDRPLGAILPAWATQMAQTCADIRKNGNSAHGTYPFVTGDLPERCVTHCDVTISPIYGPDASFLGYLLESFLLNDKETRQQQATEQDYTRLATIVESSDVAIIGNTLDGFITSWNKGAEQTYGYSAVEVIGKPISIIAPPDRAEEMAGILAMARLGESVELYDTVRVRKDGTCVDVALTMSPVRSAYGKIVGVSTIARDTTEKRRLESALRRSEERYRTLVDAHQQSIRQLERTLERTIQAMATAVEMRDPFTAGHQRQVALLACAIAEEMGLSTAQIYAINMTSVIHDIGKIYIPAELLSKPKRLNQVEFRMIIGHCQVGYDILKTIEFPWPLAEIVRQHHERLDGSGYPEGLSGEDILLEARIIAVADIVEAMASHRPYRPALGIGRALEEIILGRGILLDPVVVDACLNVFKKGVFKFDATPSIALPY